MAGKKFSEMSVQELKTNYRSLFDAIFNVDCYGTKDMMYLQSIEEELERRGYQIIESKTVRIVKAPVKPPA